MAASSISFEDLLDSNEDLNNLGKDVLDSIPPEAETTPVGFVHLPRELQLHVFSFLSHKDMYKTVAPVCQDWWKLSKDPSLCKSLSIYVRKADDTKNLALLLKKRPTLTKLKINTNYPLKEFAVCARACPMLVHLDLGGCEHLDYRIMALFVKHCPLIEEMNVASCKNVEKEVVSDIVCLKRLRMLNLSHCILVDNDCMDLITDNCTHLEDLNVAGASRVTDKAVCSLGKKCNGTLLRLVLDGRGLSDYAFAGIRLCTKLQHVWISCGDLLTDQMLLFLGKLTDLRNLALIHVRPNKLTTNAINNLFAGPNVANLVKLELSGMGIDDDGVYNITQNCKLLETLSLHWCCVIEDCGLEHIVKHCDKLSHLDLKGLHRLKGNCLQSVPEHLSCLEYLNLEYCKGIAPSLLFDLVDRMPKLRVFNSLGELVVKPVIFADDCEENNGHYAEYRFW